METLYYRLPDGIAEFLIRAWKERPSHVEGLTYNVSSQGVVLGIPCELVATVVGTCSFGVVGRKDIDFGVVGIECSEDEFVARVQGQTKFTIFTGRGVRVVYEFVEIEVEGVIFSFMAHPIWKAVHDANEYTRAAKIIFEELGLDVWLEMKRERKRFAYERVGVTCKNLDYTYPL
jgi:hypothetical protein